VLVVDKQQLIEDCPDRDKNNSQKILKWNSWIRNHLTSARINNEFIHTVFPPSTYTSNTKICQHSVKELRATLRLTAQLRCDRTQSWTRCFSRNVGSSTCRQDLHFPYTQNTSNESESGRLSRTKARTSTFTPQASQRLIANLKTAQPFLHYH
jgi:hypothetical protein